MSSNPLSGRDPAPDLLSSGGMADEIALCAGLFDTLRERSLDPPGVSRASFGAGERMAHALVERTAGALGLGVARDFAGNLFLSLAGARPDLPAIMIGSHLDAVLHGGNFDGAAGVVAGLGVLARLVRLGRRPVRTVTVMAVRAEEMSWFPTHYIGSRAAFGLLPADDLDRVRRHDTGRSLADHMTEEGFDPADVAAGRRSLDPAAIACWIEPHIEQGPVLVDAGLPVGIVTGIRGNLRYRHCAVSGVYGHAGAVPRPARRDAVMAGTAFVQALERLWLAHEAAGRDFVGTVGLFSTDAAQHTITKIPGEVRFTMDLRSEDNAVLHATHADLLRLAGEIGAARGVAIDLGAATHAAAATMDPALRRRLGRLAGALAIPTMELPSGGGHDCATFANQGVPSAMVFIRNDKGSHNPEEAMAIDDFAAALRLVAALVDEIAFA